MFLLAAPAAAAPAPTAPVAPSKLFGCYIESVNHGRAYSVCTAGSGQQRLVTKCSGRKSSDAGAWVGPGQRSSIDCDNGDFIGAKIEHRG